MNQENIVLVYLRHIRADVTALCNDCADIKNRLHGLEQRVIALSIDIANFNARMGADRRAART